jgi:lipopolysaccharide/colanic/teichoic acid biosynthesis glycosyltransferase
MTATMTRRSIRMAPAISVAAPTTAALAVFDFAAAGLLLALASPLVLAAMLAVRLTSRGPAIHTQTRLGQHGRIFTIYKIRTMVADAESLTGPRWSFPGDPRITRVGAILRALHLDELPQLWNVLRGEMSLVGPRPERPEIAAKLRRAIPGYDRRLLVKPGLTGFAQIHLPPDETVASVRRKLQYDLHGMRHRGVVFHAKVLACTALKVMGLAKLYRK